MIWRDTNGCERACVPRTNLRGRGYIDESRLGGSTKSIVRRVFSLRAERKAIAVYRSVNRVLGNFEKFIELLDGG